MQKNIDALTGLGTRPAFDISLNDAVATEATVALALIDVNTFFDINETYGHEAGDKILEQLAALLREEASGESFRTAGDEFAVVMRDTPLEQAFLKMENLRKVIQGSAARFGLPDERPVTVGIGIAQYPRDGKDADAILRAAAAALGYCKDNGSNQVILPLNEDMVMKSCYYAASSVRRLKILAERAGKKESLLLREALNDLLKKYETQREA